MPFYELYLVLAMALGSFGAWLFLSAAVQKISDFPRFRATFAAYKLVPQSLSDVVAGSVVILEVIAAVVLMLVSLVPLLVPAAGSMLSFEVGFLSLFSTSLLAPVLILSYAVAMAINLFRGRRSIDCGCGGAPMPLSKSLVIRNLVLGVGLVWALLTIAGSGLEPGAESIVGGIALLVVLSSSLVLCIAYLIVNQLLANRALHEQLWKQY